MALVHFHISSGVEKFISISVGNYLGNRGLICSGEVRGKVGVVAAGAEEKDHLGRQFVSHKRVLDFISPLD